MKRAIAIGCVFAFVVCICVRDGMGPEISSPKLFRQANHHRRRNFCAKLFALPRSAYG